MPSSSCSTSGTECSSAGRGRRARRARTRCRAPRSATRPTGLVRPRRLAVRGAGGWGGGGAVCGYGHMGECGVRK
jgi:hypothetical protein